MFAVAGALGAFPAIAFAQYTRELEQTELARLKKLPPAEAQLELEYRRVRALEKQKTVINVRSSIF